MDSHLGKVAIVGVGLIGGSIGCAIRTRQLAREVIGIGRSAGRLANARRHGAVDSTSTSLSRAVNDAELVIICTPVASIVEHVIAAAEQSPDSCLITDAGSTKARIVAEAEQGLASRAGQSSRKGAEFVGSHPIAGDHRTGVAHARADLLANGNVVVTPTSRTSSDALARLTAFWESIGAYVHVMSPQEHDEALAASSHLPHLVASALAAATPAEAIKLTAGGWRDTTRVASGDPGMWRDICGSNRDQILAALERFERELTEFRNAVEDGDLARIETLLTQAKQVRDAVRS